MLLISGLQVAYLVLLLSQLYLVLLLSQLYLVLLHSQLWANYYVIVTLEYMYQQCQTDETFFLALL